MHALGNPHFLLDPLNVKLIVAQIADHFAQVDPPTAELFQANLQQFNATLDAKFAEWQKQLAPYRGAKMVTYHKDFVYLARALQPRRRRDLEPKPGIAPSPAHIAKVIGDDEGAKRQGDPGAALPEPAKPPRRWRGRRRPLVLDMPQQPGVDEGTDDVLRA